MVCGRLDEGVECGEVVFRECFVRYVSGAAGVVVPGLRWLRWWRGWVCDLAYWLRRREKR